MHRWTQCNLWVRLPDNMAVGLHLLSSCSATIMLPVEFNAWECVYLTSIRSCRHYTSICTHRPCEAIAAPTNHCTLKHFHTYKWNTRSIVVHQTCVSCPKYSQCFDLNFEREKENKRFEGKQILQQLLHFPCKMKGFFEYIAAWHLCGGILFVHF